jgi:hypothetical protein
MLVILFSCIASQKITRHLIVSLMGWHTVGTKATSKNPPPKNYKKTLVAICISKPWSKNASVVASKQAPTSHPGPLLYEQGSYVENSRFGALMGATIHLIAFK